MMVPDELMSDLLHGDMCELLRILGLGTHARSASPHHVMRDEIIPAVETLTLHGVNPAHRKWRPPTAPRYEPLPDPVVPSD